LESPVKSWDDWKRYKEERLQPDLSERLINLDPFIAKMANVDAPVQLGVYPWGVFGTARDILGTEEFLIGFYTEPELIHDIMKTYTDLWLMIFQKVTEKIQVDHIHIWEDMSYKNGPLISLDMVQEFMIPHYDRIVEFAKENDIPLVSVDSDGDVNSLLPVMHRHGINAFLPFEVQAGNDIIKYRELYPTLGIVGGLDKNALMDTASKEAIHKELDKCELMLSMGGYVPGFDHLIPPNVSWSKWCYFVENLKKFFNMKIVSINNC
jgi:uroporphyrinogen decarboxylase